MSHPDLPLHRAPAPIRGRIRVDAADFVVEELLGFTPDGAGPHLLLWVEKRAANTGWVASQLARQSGIAPRDIGYCGLKDRHAVTRQWFSLPWASARPPDEAMGFAGEGYRVLVAERHGRKLRLGAHRANRFEIVIRELELAGVADASALEQRLATLRMEGVPNYFGEQRFGRDASNLARALAWAAAGTPPQSRTDRSFALSAARSALFNAVLAARVRDGTWQQALPGEAAMLAGSRSFFRVECVDDALLARIAAQDVHPSGPLWGRGDAPVTGAALAVEQDALSEMAALCRLLESAGLDQERRALRLCPQDLRWQLAADRLQLEFTLPRGSFATAVLHELLGGVASQAAAATSED